MRAPMLRPRPLFAILETARGIVAQLADVFVLPEERRLLIYGYARGRSGDSAHLLRSMSQGQAR